MNMGIMPVAGIPLPFLSYGGSAMIGFFAADRHHHQRARPERPVTDPATGSVGMPPTPPDALGSPRTAGRPAESATEDPAQAEAVGPTRPRTRRRHVGRRRPRRPRRPRRIRYQMSRLRPIRPSMSRRPRPTGPGAGGHVRAGPDPAPTPAPASAPVMADFRMALVSSVTVDLPNQHPTVVLRESESPRRQLTFSIALHDGVVLSHALRRIPTPRPLTHELLSGILQGFDIDVVAVRLVGRQGIGLLRRAGPAGPHRSLGALVPAVRRPFTLRCCSRFPCPSSSTAGCSRWSATWTRRARPARRRDPDRHVTDATGAMARCQPPASRRWRRSWLCSYCSWSAASAAAPPSSEIRMSRAMST